MTAAAALVFLVSFGLRIANLPVAFVNGVPQFSPADDLYHAKRMAYSAAHPLRVLSFDPNRGTSGAFCPWPPLYDVAAGAVARMLGGGTPVAALVRVAWFPPIVASFAAALVVLGLARRFGLATAVVGGAGVALSVNFLDRSRLGAIDHHFLEFPLVLGILLAILAVTRSRDTRSALRAGGLLAVALSVAMLVQPALLLAAGTCLFAVLFLEPDKSIPRLGAAFGFGVASVLVSFYRLVQPAGYPDNEWYLGAPHAALLLGAAAACVFDFLLLPRAIPRALAVPGAVAVGALAIAAVPSALSAFTGGSQFFGGDPWLRSISEFRPLFFTADGNALLDLVQLGGGALLLVPIFLTRAWWKGSRRVLLLLTIAYVAAAVSSRRFLAVAAPLLAVTAALFYSDLRRSGLPRRAIAAAAVLLVPGLVFSVGRAVFPAPAIGPEGAAMSRSAAAISRATNWPGAVLAPWSWGHLFNVVADRRVLVDNFGSAANPIEFQNSTAITFATREKFVADYCERYGVRFLVLDDPLPYFAARVDMSGFPRSAFERPPGSGEPTRLMRSTFWWRAYFEGGRERPDLGPAGAPFTTFRLVHVEPEREGGKGRGVQIWQVLPEQAAAGP